MPLLQEILQLLSKDAVLFQASPSFHYLFNVIIYGGFPLTSCSLMQVMNPLPVTEAVHFFGHLLFKFELKVFVLTEWKRHAA